MQMVQKTWNMQQIRYILKMLHGQRLAMARAGSVGFWSPARKALLGRLLPDVD
jgi:hypothetical protein